MGGGMQRNGHITSPSHSNPRATSASRGTSSAYHGFSTNNILAVGVRALRQRPVLSVLLCILLGGAVVADAFSVRWDGPGQDELREYEDNVMYREPTYNDSDAEDSEEEEPDHVDQYINVLKRWGHASRFPWKKLRRGICYRQPCSRDRDCCQLYNICDRSAKVCIDCWYGSTCKSERDCCKKFPYCQRVWKKNHSGKRYIQSGKCVDKL